MSVNKKENTSWEDIKHIVISLINEFYSDGKEFIIDKKLDDEKQADFDEIGKQIIKWDEIKHIVISFINDFYSEGKEFVIDESLEEPNSNLDDLEQKIVKI